MNHRKRGRFRASANSTRILDCHHSMKAGKWLQAVGAVNYGIIWVYKLSVSFDGWIESKGNH